MIGINEICAMGGAIMGFLVAAAWGSRFGAVAALALGLLAVIPSFFGTYAAVLSFDMGANALIW